MRNTNEGTLGELISQLLDQYKLRSRLEKTQITRLWEEMMGTAIARRTTSISVVNGKLILTLNSAPLKQELVFKANEIMEAVNRELGTPSITSIEIR
jgi:predicted nucleic acid-binding Zn ribbon protein